MSQSPQYLPATPTAERTERFYSVLCRFGVDKILDAVLSPPPAIKPGPQKVSDVKRKKQDDAPPATLDVSLNVGEILREIAAGGALSELAEAVLDIPEGTGGPAPIKAIREAIDPFVEESLALVGGLISFGISTSSTPPMPEA